MVERLVTFKISEEMLHEVDQRRLVLGMTRTDYIKALFLLDIAKHILDDTSNVQNFQQEVNVKLDLLLTSLSSVHQKLERFDYNVLQEAFPPIDSQDEQLDSNVMEEKKLGYDLGMKKSAPSKSIDTDFESIESGGETSISAYLSKLKKSQVRPYRQIIDLIYTHRGMTRRELARVLSRRASKLTPILTRLKNDGVIKIKEIPNSNGDVLLVPLLQR